MFILNMRKSSNSCVFIWCRYPSETVCSKNSTRSPRDFMRFAKTMRSYKDIFAGLWNNWRGGFKHQGLAKAASHQVSRRASQWEGRGFLKCGVLKRQQPIEVFHTEGGIRIFYNPSVRKQGFYYSCLVCKATMGVLEGRNKSWQTKTKNIPPTISQFKGLNLPHIKRVTPESHECSSSPELQHLKLSPMKHMPLIHTAFSQGCKGRGPVLAMIGQFSSLSEYFIYRHRPSIIAKDNLNWVKESKRKLSYMYALC